MSPEHPVKSEVKSPKIVVNFSKNKEKIKILKVTFLVEEGKLVGRSSKIHEEH